MEEVEEKEEDKQDQQQDAGEEENLDPAFLCYLEGPKEEPIPLSNKSRRPGMFSKQFYGLFRQTRGN